MLTLGAARGSFYGMTSAEVQNLSTLRGESIASTAVESVPASEDSIVQAEPFREDQPDQPELKEGQGLTCLTCGIGATGKVFDGVEEQRAHFQTDWHRHNVQRRLKAKAPLSEEAFELMLEQADEVSSISGSGNSSEDEESRAPQSEVQEGHSTAGLCCFRHADSSMLAVWKAILQPPALKGPQPQQQLLTQLQALHRTPGRWVIILSRGGHFAASVFDTAVKVKPGPQQKRDAPVFSVVDHKTFHRYVIRAKSGGRQAGKDATGKHSKSAGSTIRRHNEAMLIQDIQTLLLAWKEHLKTAALIFVHAPAANSAPLYSTEPRVLTRGDERIRGVPFNTRRPTFSETQRVMKLLLTVYDVEQTALPPPPPKPATAKSAREANSASSAAGQPEVSASTPVPLEPLPSLDTELHTAAREGDTARVTELLEGGADPTVQGDEGRTAYAVATNKAVRDLFRKYMAAHPDQWEWGSSGVPSALTPELQAHQAAKQAEKKARQREREKEKKRVAAQDSAEKEQQARAAAEAEVEAAAAAAAALSLRSKGGKSNSKVRASPGSSPRVTPRMLTAVAAVGVAFLLPRLRSAKRNRG
ncbi:hypothetical protein WJX73_003812 [Symbiochloris irregularis]|uniref:VLRF1 domain-containing protein n=1 Tax=Symbiochloris irregularis TaxID=706552 RepID=A0AAW1PME5_9CHLO